MSTTIQPRDEVFPGYMLAERIGSGGYAEVWRATAPGGINKAVKIVYGCHDDQLASQEMKAMERIRDVRHPFVVSLERFEVVDGRLVILTELADMSLEQRAQQCRAQGLPGIPRELLLRYLSDAADALDFLAQRHSLQHLDIKPANLLILGDHVKVADFGLVKELATRTHNSMVAGMTPTYSAPEMFDDAPSPHSDQYSLAIVFQEMLTGVLPFPGRTAAQLANQHLRSQPQLAALAEADRPIVARALAKNPTERFPSSSDFVKALIVSGKPTASRAAAKTSAPSDSKTKGSTDSKPKSDATMPRAAAAKPSAAPSSAVDTATQPTDYQPQRTIDTDVNRTLAVEALPHEPVVDVPVPEVAADSETTLPTLYIAIGGVGIRILSHFRDLSARQADSIQQAAPVALMAIDTDRQELKDTCSTKWKHPLSSNDAVCTSLRLPQEYRDRTQLNLEWLSHRWLYNIPRSLETRGYRPLGRLALIDHLDEVLALVDRKLAALATFGVPSVGVPPLGGSQPAEAGTPTGQIRVVLLIGMGGGTGGGMAIDLANAVRSRIHKSGRRAQSECVLVCTCVGNASATPLSVANTYAFLRELQVASAFGNCGLQGESRDLRPFESADRPFDTVYCVRAKQRAEGSIDDGLRAIAEQLAVASTDCVRQVLEVCRQTPTERESAGRDSLQFRTFGAATLTGRERKRIERLAQQSARMIEQFWLGDVCPTEWKQLEGAEEATPTPADPAANSTPTDGDAPIAAAVISRVQIEDWRHKFGELASTRFAYEVVSRIARQSALRGAYRSTLLSSQDPNKFVSAASEALSSICERIAAAPKDSDPLAGEDAAIIDKLLLNSHRILASCIDEIERLPADKPLDAVKMDRVVQNECMAGVEQCILRQSAASGETSAASPDSEAQEALDRAHVDLLQCGYDRRTLIVVPYRAKVNPKSSEAIDALTKARTTATLIVAEVDEPVVYSEGSGISPKSFARGLERVYSGIAEAASRRYTRTDIDWSSWPA